MAARGPLFVTARYPRMLHTRDTRDLGRLELLARQVVEGFIIGLHKSPFHGFSVEFAEHRIYNPGDNLRNVDWKVFARSDRMFVKRYEEETNLRCQLVVDASSSMYFPADRGADDTKLAFAAQAAAALMYLLQRQRDAFGLTLYGEGVAYQSPQRSSTAHLRGLTAELERALSDYADGRATATAQTLHAVAETLPKRSLVFAFSDFLGADADLDALFAALQHLRHRKHEVVLFQVNDRAREVDFDYDNRPHEFVDMETGERVKLHPAEVADAYRRAVASQRARLRETCLRYRVDLVDADTRAGFRPVLQSYLLKRRRMGA